MAKGIAIRKRLWAVVESFEAVLMITFTIDPKLYDSSEHAWRDMCKRRCVGEAIKELRRQELLLSDRYFCAVEWQENTMPHFHVLVDAAFIPHAKVQQIWNRLRPKNVPLIQGGEPLLGWVHLSRRKGTKPYVCNYVTAYLVKKPRHPYPDWVLDYQGRIPRYRTSRGFWGTKDGAKSGHAKRCPPDCFCDRCRNRKPRRTTREITVTCGMKSVLVDETPVEGGTQRRFRREVKVPFDEIRERLGVDKTTRRINVDDDESRKVLDEVEQEYSTWSLSQLVNKKAA